MAAIRSMVESLPELWDNSKLSLVRDEEVPKLLKIHRGRVTTEFIPIPTMLPEQNKELGSQNFKVGHRQVAIAPPTKSCPLDVDCFEKACARKQMKPPPAKTSTAEHLRATSSGT